MLMYEKACVSVNKPDKSVPDDATVTLQCKSVNMYVKYTEVVQQDPVRHTVISHKFSVIVVSTC